jgi:WD40 repeat protein
MIQEGNLRSASFSPDGKYIASLSDGVQIWEPFTGRQIASFKHDGYTSSFAFSPDKKHIATSGCDKYDADYKCLQDSARVWEFATGREVSSMVYKGSVQFLAFSSDGKKIISTDDHTIIVWDANTGKEISRISDKDNSILAISSDGKYVISSRCDKTDGSDCVQGFTRLWKAETGENIVSMTVNTSVATFSPDGKYVILTNCIKFNMQQLCTQSTFDEWGIASGEKIIHMTFEGYINSVTFSPNGKYVILDKCIARNVTTFYCTQSSLSEWEIATGEEIIQMTYEGNLSSVAFSPDGKHVVLNSNRVLEAATGKEIAHISHAGEVIDFAFSPDGKYIVSAYRDESARVWELVTGKEIAYAKHIGSVSTVTFSPDGKYVVSGGCIESDMVGCTKSSVRIWMWQPEDVIANACAYLPRNLTRAEWAQFIGDAMPYQAVCENLPIEPEVTITPTATP